MAAKPYAYTRLVIGGTNGSGGGWSIGLACQTSAAITNEALTAWLAGIADDVGNSFNGGADQWGLFSASNTALRELRAYHYPSGSTSASEMGEYVYGSPISGLGGSNSPYLQACCISLLTSRPGRSGRGRVYIPADGASLVSHQFDATALGHTLQGMKACIDHVNGSTIDGEDVNVCVATQAALIVVTRVRVDSIPDTQHRRSDQTTAITTLSDDV